MHRASDWSPMAVTLSTARGVPRTVASPPANGRFQHSFSLFASNFQDSGTGGPHSSCVHVNLRRLGLVPAVQKSEYVMLNAASGRAYPNLGERRVTLLGSIA